MLAFRERISLIGAAAACRQAARLMQRRGGRFRHDRLRRDLFAAFKISPRRRASALMTQMSFAAGLMAETGDAATPGRSFTGASADASALSSCAIAAG